MENVILLSHKWALRIKILGMYSASGTDYLEAMLTLKKSDQAISTGLKKSPQIGE
jgi:hypothetical protein